MIFTQDILALIATMDDPEQKSAVEQIFEEYFSTMKRQAYKMLLDEEHAQDAVMLAFQHIVENSERFLHLECNDLQALLFIYVRNATLNYIKEQKKHSMVFSTTVVDPETNERSELEFPDPTQNVEAIVITKELRISVRDAIQKLPDTYREVLMLWHYFEHTGAEIAELLKIDEGNVRARLSRARALLGKMLEENNLQ